MEDTYSTVMVRSFCNKDRFCTDAHHPPIEINDMSSDNTTNCLDWVDMKHLTQSIGIYLLYLHPGCLLLLNQVLKTDAATNHPRFAVGVQWFRTKVLDATGSTFVFLRPLPLGPGIEENQDCPVALS